MLIYIWQDLNLGGESTYMQFYMLIHMQLISWDTSYNVDYVRLYLMTRSFKQNSSFLLPFSPPREQTTLTILMKFQERKGKTGYKFRYCYLQRPVLVQCSPQTRCSQLYVRLPTILMPKFHKNQFL